MSQHSLSGESEFCDADDGGVSFAETPETPSSAWLAARMVEGAPGEPQAGEDAGTRGENWLPESRSHAEQRAGGPNFEDDGSEDDSLGFEDARDPISEVRGTKVDCFPEARHTPSLSLRLQVPRAVFFFRMKIWRYFLHDGKEWGRPDVGCLSGSETEG